jgi:hypothetical protein
MYLVVTTAKPGIFAWSTFLDFTAASYWMPSLAESAARILAVQVLL